MGNGGKSPFLKKNINVADVWKTHPFNACFGHGCVASHVMSDPPSPLRNMLQNIFHDHV